MTQIIVETIVNMDTEAQFSSLEINQFLLDFYRRRHSWWTGFCWIGTITLIVWIYYGRGHPHYYYVIIDIIYVLFICGTTLTDEISFISVKKGKQLDVEKKEQFLQFATYLLISRHRRVSIKGVPVMFNIMGSAIIWTSLLIGVSLMTGLYIFGTYSITACHLTVALCFYGIFDYLSSGLSLTNYVWFLTEKNKTTEQVEVLEFV